eukprot:3507412-Rhodomonas_salina.1
MDMTSGPTASYTRSNSPPPHKGVVWRLLRLQERLSEGRSAGSDSARKASLMAASPTSCGWRGAKPEPMIGVKGRRGSVSFAVDQTQAGDRHGHRRRKLRQREVGHGFATAVWYLAGSLRVDCLGRTLDEMPHAQGIARLGRCHWRLVVHVVERILGLRPLSSRTSDAAAGEAGE